VYSPKPRHLEETQNGRGAIRYEILLTAAVAKPYSNSLYEDEFSRKGPFEKKGSPLETHFRVNGS
jgi:hypothetical protein